MVEERVATTIVVAINGVDPEAKVVSHVGGDSRSDVSNTTMKQGSTNISMMLRD